MKAAFSDARGTAVAKEIDRLVGLRADRWACLMTAEQLTEPWQIVQGPAGRCRVGVWVRNCLGIWHPVLFSPGLPKASPEFVVCDVAVRERRIPWPVAAWLFRSLGLSPSDTLVDLSGWCGDAWEFWREQTA